MAHLRYDPIQQRWVIFAPDRLQRPADYRLPEIPVPADKCPFCPGNESMTPPETFALRPESREPDTIGWTIRVVPNKFPAVSEFADDDSAEDGFQTLPAAGIHEVIIEAPPHDADVHQLPVGNIIDILSVYKSRSLLSEGMPGIKQVLIFRNLGYFAGATRSHPHSQLIAIPIVPRTIQTELDSAQEYLNRENACLFCTELGKELKSGKRIIAQNEHFTAFSPFASRTPFEITIMPLVHLAKFSETPDNLLTPLAEIYRAAVAMLKNLLPKVNYNLILHTAPVKAGDDPSTVLDAYHWHFEIIPRIGTKAGFEIGSGFYINSVLPENAVKKLLNQKD